MICDKDTLLETVMIDLKKTIFQHRFGEFGFTVTIHEGKPVKITRINTVNVVRKTGGLLEVNQ